VVILAALVLQFLGGESFCLKGRSAMFNHEQLQAATLDQAHTSTSEPTNPWRQDSPLPPSLIHEALDKKQKKSVQKQNEYNWLTWLYRNWKSVPIGELEEDIVRRMVPAFSLYAKRRTVRSAEQAEQMLDRYIAEYKAGNAAAELNTTIFHAAMDAHAKCGQPEQASAILQKMVKLSKSDESLGHLQPDVFSFTILATAFAKSRHPQAADKAENLLRHMENQNMTITTLTYNVVLNAIAVCHDSAKARRARLLVKKMERISRDGGESAHCTPDLYTYQSWMAACSRTRGGLDQTIQIFSALDQRAALGHETLRPNAHCFAAAIHAWAYSSRSNKASEAYKLLQEMRRRYEELGQASCRPNVVVFTSVINACVNPNSKAEAETAFAIAQLVFDELLQSDYGSPNFLTYAAFLHACATALEEGEDRDSVVKRKFEMCAEYGCVGKIVVEKFREAASIELQDSVLGRRGWEELPNDWTRFVSGERYQTPPKTLSGRTGRRYNSQDRKRRAEPRTTTFGCQTNVRWTAEL